MSKELPPLDEWIDEHSKDSLDADMIGGDWCPTGDVRDRIAAERMEVANEIRACAFCKEPVLAPYSHHDCGDVDHRLMSIRAIAQRELIREVMALLNNTRRWFPKDGGGMFQLPPSDPIPDACYRSNAELQRALRDLAKRKGWDP